LTLGLVAAIGVLVGSVALVVDATHGGWGPGPAMMGGTRMMGSLWLAGNGATVDSIPAARDRASAAAAQAGLRPGEVIWFENGFYVELKDTAGDPATEVIVDPASGTVFTEPGPAMMWNTRYGMHSTGSASVSPQRAQRIATEWLDTNLPGRTAQPPDSYPGYYTLETTGADGSINGMLSVNAATGQVWYHSWHGQFIAKDDS
jgi:hypothetical protein